jgi:CDGSH-type Zn-finger protein
MFSGSHDAPDDAVTITPYRDGPYLVRGSFRVLDQDGNEIPLARRTIALCRCGRSSMRPFCDGTHRSSGFRAPSEAELPGVGSEPLAGSE